MGFHFLHPEWLWLLPVAALPWWWHWRRGQAQGQWEKWVDRQLLPFVLVGQAGRRGYLPPLLLALALVLAVLAMAGPAWEKREVPLYRAQQPLVVALDFSVSMYAQDVTPSRLAQARFALLDVLQARRDAPNALIVFAADAFVVSPLTDDQANIEEQVKNLAPDVMPAQGSLLAPAIQRAAALLQQAGMGRGGILLLTDGVNDLQAALTQAQAAYRQGYRVSVVAFGAAEGAPVPLPRGGLLVDSAGKTVLAKTDLAALQQIAQAGGGSFMQAKGAATNWQPLLRQWEGGADTLQEGQGRQADTWVNQGYWLVLLLLPLAALAFRRGWLAAVLVSICVPLSPPAHAWTWRDLWLTPDQQAQQSLQVGKAKEAAALFQDPAWKAAAAYKAGDYAAAAQAYAQLPGVAARYNYGNAQARLGNYPAAIAAYQAVLEQDPNHADARHNLELLQQVQQQSQQSSPNNPQQSPQGGQTQPQPGQGQQDGQEQQSAQGQGQQEQAAQQPEQGQDGSKQQQAEADTEERQDQQQDGPQDEAGQAQADPQQREQQQAVEQWLNRVPDDPAGLWRRKFLYQYRQRGTQVQGEAW